MIQELDEIKMNVSELNKYESVANGDIKTSLNEIEKNDKEKIINVNDVT